MSKLITIDLGFDFSEIEYELPSKSLVLWYKKEVTKDVNSIMEDLFRREGKPIHASIDISCSKHLRSFDPNLFQDLETLSIRGGDENDNFSLNDWIPYLKNLKSLSPNDDVAVDCSKLSELPKLESVNFKFSKNKSHLSKIGNCRKLRFLGLEKIEDFWSELGNFDPVDTVKDLKLFASRGTLANLKGIEIFSNVENLVVGNYLKSVDDINKLRQLKTLSLESNVSISNYMFLSGLPLQKLNISPNRLDSFSFLNDLQELEELRISSSKFCKVDDGDLSPIFSHPKLKTLIVSNGVKHYREMLSHFPGQSRINIA